MGTSSRLDKAMHERLLSELCDRWLEKQLVTIDSSKIQAV